MRGGRIANCITPSCLSASARGRLYIWTMPDLESAQTTGEAPEVNREL